MMTKINFGLHASNDLQRQEANERNVVDDRNWPFGTISEKPAASPFKECFFNAIPGDLSSLKDLSEIQSKALASLQTLTKLLNLTKPLSELPKFPIKLDCVENLWKLQSIDFMKTIQHPISFDLDGDGWPFFIIKVLNAKDHNIARAIYLYCGPQGSHCIRWDGWWENHCGNSRPSFFSERKFIDLSGNLVNYPQEIIQRFKDLITKGMGEDLRNHEWILAPQKSFAN